MKAIESRNTIIAFKTGTATVSISKSGFVVGLLLCSACARKVELVRPEEVPPEATYIGGFKFGGFWQRCALATSGQAVHCWIWNGAGHVLEDEEFLPYDGAAPPTADELKISDDPAAAGGRDWVFLSNGRFLLPRSRFDQLKKHLDEINELKSKTVQPR